MSRSFLVLFFLLAAGARADSVLVLPFFNLSKSSNLDWIGESIAETVREAVAVEGLVTHTRDDRQEALRRLSIRPYVLLTRASIVKIGEAAGAAQVVWGQYEIQAGDPAAPSAKATLRITSRVLDLKHIRQGPELNELGALEDLASLETHLAWQAIRFLAPRSAPSEQAFRSARPTLRVDAIESYTRGLLASVPEQKQRFFTQAARLDPRFSQPCFELGRMYVAKQEHRVAVEWLGKVSRSDSHYFEAQFLLGLSRYGMGDYAAAEAAFRVVSETLPLNEVFNNLAAAQSRRNLPQAVENFGRALEGDSADPDYHFNLGYALWKRGQFAQAADSFRGALDRRPDDPEATLMLGRCLAKSGVRSGDPKSDGLERIKLDYEETAYRQLKAALEVKSKP